MMDFEKKELPETMIYFFGGNSSLAGIPSGRFLQRPCKATVISELQGNFSPLDQMIRELASGSFVTLLIDQ